MNREQERIAKGEAARRETERILREQQAEVDAKKTDMVKRDIQREKVSPSRLTSPVQFTALTVGWQLCLSHNDRRVGKHHAIRQMQ